MLERVTDKRAGVYRLWHSQTHRSYVGSSSNLCNRLYQHRSELRRGLSKCVALQRAYNKYGPDWHFQILIVCSAADVLMYEQRAIDHYEAHGGTYNAAKSAVPLDGLRRYAAEGKHPQRGQARSVESKALTSASLRAFYAANPLARAHQRELLSRVPTRGLDKKPRKTAGYSEAMRRRHAARREGA